MAAVAMTGNDTLTLNNYVFANFATGDVGVLTYPNEISSVRTGKNGSAVYALNETGLQSELKLRVVRYSADDQFLLAQLNSQINNFSAFVLMQGTLVKKIGFGTGSVGNDTYILSGGVFSKQVEVKINVEGDEQQSVAEYSLKFSNTPRALT
jgi:hypothetical protein